MIKKSKAERAVLKTETEKSIIRIQDLSLTSTNFQTKIMNKSGLNPMYRLWDPKQKLIN